MFGCMFESLNMFECLSIYELLSLFRCICLSLSVLKCLSIFEFIIYFYEWLNIFECLSKLGVVIVRVKGFNFIILIFINNDSLFIIYILLNYKDGNFV